MRRRQRIQERTDAVIAGNLLHLKQGLGVALALNLCHRLLKRQKRRALGEKHRKGAQPRLFRAIKGVVTRALIGQSLQHTMKMTHQRVKGKRWFWPSEGIAHR